jgi:hypothetical protein
VTSPIAELSAAFQRGTLVLLLGADLPAALTGLPSRADLARGLAERHGLRLGQSLAATAQQTVRQSNRFAFTAFLGEQLSAQIGVDAVAM